MHTLYALAAATDMLLSILKALFPQHVQPLGGGHLQQLGVVFATAFVIIEVKKHFHILIKNKHR
jgi:hypothetical protein